MPAMFRDQRRAKRNSATSLAGNLKVIVLINNKLVDCANTSTNEKDAKRSTNSDTTPKRGTVNLSIKSTCVGGGIKGGGKTAQKYAAAGIRAQVSTATTWNSHH